VSTLEVHEDGDSDVTMATNKDVKLEVKSKSVKSNPENAKNFRRNIKNSKCSEKVVLKSLNKDQPTKKEVDDEQVCSLKIISIISTLFIKFAKGGSRSNGYLG